MILSTSSDGRESGSYAVGPFEIARSNVAQLAPVPDDAIEQGGLTDCHLKNVVVGGVYGWSSTAVPDTEGVDPFEWLPLPFGEDIAMVDERNIRSGSTPSGQDVPSGGRVSLRIRL